MWTMQRELSNPGNQVRGNSKPAGRDRHRSEIELMSSGFESIQKAAWHESRNGPAIAVPCAADECADRTVQGVCRLEGPKTGGVQSR
jgi:hypothetical protein